MKLIDKAPAPHVAERRGTHVGHTEDVHRLLESTLDVPRHNFDGN